MLYGFELKGLTPLLIHADDVEASDRLGEWRKDAKNKNLSVPGDDRSPAWTWQTYLYTDGQVLTVPTDNLMVSLRQAGATMILKKSTTFKSITQSGLLMTTEHLPIEVNGKTISVAAVASIEGMFREHTEAVQKLGFRLFVKRARVNKSKHIRVRPRFDVWSLRGQVEVLAEREMPLEVLQELFTIAGTGKGLCDWRPSSPASPGVFGRFSATVRPAGNGKKKR